MRGVGMYQRANNYMGVYLRRFGEQCDSLVCRGPSGQGRLSQCCRWQRGRRASCVASLLLLTLATHPIFAQEKAPEPLRGINVNLAVMSPAPQQAPALPAKRSITLSNAVSIFLQQNLQLVAGRYDIDTADAEKLTARLRPNPQLTVGLSGLPLNLSGPFLSEQTYSYAISQSI